MPAGKVGASDTAHMQPVRHPLSSAFSSLVSLAALAAGLFLAAHHPISPVAMMIGCAAAMIVCVRFDHAWLLLLPALLPIIDLAPWSGWLTFEEFDILILGSASGAWFRHAWAPGRTAPARPSSTLLILSSVFLAFLAASFWRGIEDAGGLEYGLFQGYDGSMNSLRLAKSFVLAALFVPLLGRVSSRLNPSGVELLGWGMTLGLAFVSLAAIWERVAFPGLLNFSANYRITALFWEMHVGGAALDGFLVLTLPFAVFMMLRSKNALQLLPAGLAVGLGIYASLTTFSRGVYLAAGISLALMAILLIGRNFAGNHKPSGMSRLKAAVIGLVAVLSIAGLSYLSFRHGGYRSLLAIFGCMAIFMMTMEDARNASRRVWIATVAIAVLLALSSFALAWLLERGAYVAYTILLFLAFAGHIPTRRNNADASRSLSLAAAATLPVAALLVAGNWGGPDALADSAISVTAIFALAAWGIRSTEPVWPREWRRQGIALAFALPIAGMVAVMSGGAYMSGRFSASERDFDGRLQHWQAALALLQSPSDWLFGKGLGRFPSSFFFGAPGNEFPGSYRTIIENGNMYLALSGPRYQRGFGEVLRIAQRVELGPSGRYLLEFDARAPHKVLFDFGICPKHLLYSEGCSSREHSIPDTNSGWRHEVIEFDGSHLTNGSWYAPQLVFFSLGIETMGGRADIDNLKLTDPLGRPMLVNGDFTHDMARWFFTSDHNHMPWHMKSMFLHVLFEQGILGLAAFLLIISAALYRLQMGRRSYHPLAPAMLASIVGFMIVGLFDSLLDAPRVAFLFFLVLLLGIQGRKQK